MLATVAAFLVAGCNHSDSNNNADIKKGLDLSDIGDNDTNVVVCIGDSITEGSAESVPYPAQLGALVGKTVINEGRGGERSTTGAERAEGVLRERKPAVLIILYGANDLIQGYDDDTVLDALSLILEAARANKTVPVLTTLTPMIRGHELWGGAVKALNERIRELAAAQGAALVDLEQEFSSAPELYLGDDGLHPTDLGNQVIAAAFADVF